MTDVGTEGPNSSKSDNRCGTKVECMAGGILRWQLAVTRNGSGYREKCYTEHAAS